MLEKLYIKQHQICFVVPTSFACENCVIMEQGRSQRGARGARPPIEMLFQVFKLNFSCEICLKFIILVTNFQKLPSAGGSPPLALLNLQFW